MDGPIFVVLRSRSLAIISEVQKLEEDQTEVTVNDRPHQIRYSTNLGPIFGSNGKTNGMNIE